VDARPDLLSLTALVTEVAPSGDAATQTFVVKASLSDPSIMAGVGVTALARGESRPALWIPTTAVYSTGGMDLVSVVDNGGLTRTRAVTLGRTRNGQVEVLSGLQSGERLVDKRQGPIAEGTQIAGISR
jgi:hypothetical protein